MRLITHRKVFRSFRRAGRCFFPGWRCDKSDSHSIHFPPTVLVLSQSPSPSFCAVHASPLSLPGPFLKANFPRRWNAPLPSPSSRSGLIEIEMLLPSFPSNLCRSTRRLQTSPACYPIYPSSLFSSHWLLMCLPSNLLPVNRPPMKDGGRKKRWYSFRRLRWAAATERVSEDIMLSPTILGGSVCESQFLIRHWTAGMTTADRYSLQLLIGARFSCSGYQSRVWGPSAALPGVLRGRGAKRGALRTIQLRLNDC